MLSLRQWKGAIQLVTDGVVHGSRAVERVQLGTARRVFFFLELVPAIAPVAGVVHVAHDAITQVTHASIRGVAAVGGGAITGALGWAESDPGEASKQHPEPVVPHV